MIKVSYRFVNNTPLVHYLPSVLAHDLVDQAKKQGADHHVMQGCWNQAQRCYLDDHGNHLEMASTEPVATA